MATMKEDNLEEQEDPDILESTRAIRVENYASCRADEINTMVRALEGPRKGKRIFQRLPRHMRRRAMSHNVKRLPRSMRSQGQKEMNKSKPAQKRGGDNIDKEDGEPTKKKSRRHRRRPSNLRSEFNRRQRRFIWLETHLWHAKRFKMVDKWGHRIPLHSNEKGVRAAYRAVVKHCLMQDISYFGAVELVGTQEKILNVMNLITNRETGVNLSEERYLNGSHHGRTILYKDEKYPYEAIGPADFMWDPVEDSTSPLDGRTRQLWLWLHPACYDEAFEELKRVCSKDGTAGVVVNDLRADLVRFHFEGPLSHSVLVDALKISDVTCHPDASEERHWWENVYQDSNRLAAFQEQSTLWEGMSVEQTATDFDSNCILALTVRDPRHLLPKKRGQVSDPKKVERTKMSERMNSSCTWSPIWDQNVRKEVKTMQMSQHKINQMRSEQLVPGTPLSLGRQESRIPVVLLQNPGYQSLSGGKHHKAHFGILGYGAGWDVILPSGWGMEFWVAFYYRGARVGGIREASSSRRQKGAPEFPLDFPDTQSGKMYGVNLQSELETNYLKKPPAKRLNYSKVGTENPFIHPWWQLILYWENEIKQDEMDDEMKESLEKVELMEWNPSAKQIPSTERTNIFVLRNIQYLKQLQLHCVGKVFEKSKTLIPEVKRQLDKTEFGSMQTESAGETKTNIPPPLPSELLFNLKSSLVFVTMRMVNRGAPSIFAMICLPTEEDLNSLEENPSSPGPIEPKHTGLPTPRLAKESKSVKKLKTTKDECTGGDEIDGKGGQTKLDEEILDKLQMSSSECSSSTTNINCCSRTIIGYVTNGAHSFSTGVGGSVGLCSLVGLSKLLRQKLLHRNAVVLIRDANCHQYRYAYLNIQTSI
ncbi:ribonucleases P/MRP protein subunit POP1-like [Anneissia japonica]|uniref:ribonucleases P/MRP protein subunit POP1-like n=1 Tax=Anneissia japonica TaxID=1529436 RepID=UPI0014255DF2|nr:ribonucleases P/MRP protein subunit POP1-like [Anneissia japonica]